MSRISSPTGRDRLQFIAGQVYRELRPDALQVLEARIRQSYRGTNMQRQRLPKRFYVRVLAVLEDHVVVISTEDPRARECFYPLEQAMHFVETAAWLKTEKEPLAVMKISDENLTEAQKARMEKNSDLIQPLIDMDTDALFPKARWPVVCQIARDRSVEPVQVFRVFIRYLQGGMSPQALAGRWFRRLNGIGLGAGMAKFAESRVPRKSAGRPRLDGLKPFIVQEMDMRKIIAGSRKYFFAGPTAGKWRRAWKLTVADLFLDLDCSNGVPTERELSQWRPGTYPSYRQFRYWSAMDDEFELLLRKLHGNREFELQLRRRRQRTEANVAGSGAVFIVDPTPLDWHLVHQITRLPLEKTACLYLVVDAFSHLIVGFYLHLGNESYDAVSLALLAAAEDKVALCARYGVTINPDEWVAACLPTRLAEDGAGANYKHGILVKKRVIRGLTIVPPYRPDLKGLVEAYNSAMRRKAESVVGHSNGPRQRGEENPLALACMDYFESVRLIISWILQTNRRIDRDYQLTPEMMAEGVVPTRRDLWDYGISGRAGLRKTWSQESLMRWCLPTGKALMTRDGVKFGEMIYEPIPGTLPKFQDWCARAADTGNWSVNVSYHPASYSSFYLHDGDELVKMQLTPQSSAFATWSVAEYEAQKATSAVAFAVREGENEVLDIAREREQQQIVEGAMAKTEAARGSVAARRHNRSDRKANTKDQKRLIAAQGLPSAPAGSVVNAAAYLQEEDEAEIIEMMEGVP